MSYIEYSLAEIAEKIRKREVSIEEVVRESLDRCRAIRKYNAFISLYEEESMQIARAYDSLLDAGYTLGPLHGVSIVIKDNIAMAGTITTAGSKVLADNLTPEDATVVQKLKGAGAIIIGKTNMHEFAAGITSSKAHYGFARNPWDYSKNPAGSSGGTGAAVAARAAFGGLGTDTGGSVRLPASVNGITGIRPSIGRVSNHGVVPLAYSQDTVGPICRTVEDCALMLSVMAGHDHKDMNTALEPAEDYTADLDRGIDGLRVGVIRDYCMTKNQPDVEKCFEAALETMEKLGAVIKYIEIDNLDMMVAAQLIVDTVEPSAYHLGWLRERPEDYTDEGIRTFIEGGCMFTGTQYYQALAYRTLLKKELEEAFKDVDVIVMPTLPFTALSIDDPIEQEDPLGEGLRYTGIPSITGKPALDIPAGFDSEGMPVGIMLIADSFRERLLFRVGSAFQQATDFHKKAPVMDHLLHAASFAADA